MTLNPILYAEDEEDDVFFIQRAFEQAQITNPLVIVPDGVQAIDYLGGTGKYSGQSPQLSMALLDINLPGKSGLEVLKWIRSQPVMCSLPVIMLTSSCQEADVHRAYQQGANGFLRKPSRPQELLEMIKALKDYWLTHNRAL